MSAAVKWCFTSPHALRCCTRRALQLQSQRAADRIGGSAPSGQYGPAAQGTLQDKRGIAAAGLNATGAALIHRVPSAVRLGSTSRLCSRPSGMGLENIVKTVASTARPSQLAAFATIRKEILRGHKPASTLVYVTALNNPDWQVEIEAITTSQGHPDIPAITEFFISSAILTSSPRKSASWRRQAAC